MLTNKTNKTPIEVFTAFTNLPEGSVEAYLYHKRYKFLNVLGLLFYGPFTILSTILWQIHAFDGKILASSVSIIGPVFYLWFFIEAIEATRKHTKAIDEILNCAHKGCYNGCYNLLEGKTNKKALDEVMSKLNSNINIKGLPF